MNVTREDIIGLCGLDEDEVAAIAEHEHVPEVVAAALGGYLLQQHLGVETIRGMIRDDIRRAIADGDRPHAALLVRVLHRFLAEQAPG